MAKIKTKCSKCLTEDRVFPHGLPYQLDKQFCEKCYKAFDWASNNLLVEFMKENFGKCNLPAITKDIINARIKRAKGLSPWRKERLSASGAKNPLAIPKKPK